MIKYIAIIDYKAETKKGFGHKDLEAKNALEAMNEAEKAKTDDVYLIKIAEKIGKSETREGAKRVRYKEILVCRSSGWKVCNEKNGEMASVWERAEYKQFADYQIVEL